MRKRQWYRIRNAASEDEATVYIYDEIDSFYGVDAQQFAKEIAALDVSTVHVRINSPGGSVFDGMAIYNALKRHPAEIVTHVDGLAASAASVVALAGDQILMGAGSFMMIHNAWGVAIGDASTMRQMADTLEKINGSLVGIYATRTGKDADELQALLDAETWMNADEAVEEGFADDTEDGKKVSNAFDLSRFKNVPQPLQGTRPSEMPRVKVETIRDLETLLREEGGLSNAAAKAIAAHGFKAAPEPRDEDGELVELMAALEERGRVFAAN